MLSNKVEMINWIIELLNYDYHFMMHEITSCY